MPTFEITTPEGKTLEVNAPDGATKEQALAYAQANYKPEKPATAMDRVNAGITGLNRGIAGLAGLPMDTMENIYNLLKAGVGYGAQIAGRPDLMPKDMTHGTPLSSEWISQQLAKGGINTQNPRPDDPLSRGIYAGGTVAGGSMLPIAGPKVPGNFASLATPQELASIAKSAVAPTVGATVAATASDNPMAPAIGAMIPAAGTLARAGINGVINPDTASQNRQTFAEAGSRPTVGQATGSTFFQALENLVVRFPGG